MSCSKERTIFDCISGLYHDREGIYHSDGSYARKRRYIPKCLVLELEVNPTKKQYASYQLSLRCHKSYEIATNKTTICKVEERNVPVRITNALVMPSFPALACSTVVPQNRILRLWARASNRVSFSEEEMGTLGAGTLSPAEMIAISDEMIC